MTRVALTYREHVKHLIELARERGLVQAVEVVPSGYAALGLAPLLARRLTDLGLPYSFHFVEGSLGSADFLASNHVGRVRTFLAGGAEPGPEHRTAGAEGTAGSEEGAAHVAPFAPIHVSDHLTACRAGDLDLEMNLPLPADEDALDVYAENVAYFAAGVGAPCPVLIEHVPSYFTFTRSTMSSGELYARLLERTGCGALVDLHNLYCDELNRGEDAIRFIERLPPASIKELHVAGGRWLPGQHTYLDGHDRDLPPRVFELLDFALRYAKPELVVLERENELKGFDAVLADLERINTLVEEAGAR